MSATNHTANYNLPQFIGSDKPAWLTDVNGAMSAIDLGIAAAQAKADGADTKADTVGANLETLSGSVTTLDTAVTTLSGTVTSQGGTINTITSLIGNGEPTTTDKTIIGAINELDAERDAEDISYDNTTSGLTASNVQAAIDEVAAGAVTPEADDVVYDNTTSGLTATNVQAAIDELAGAGPSPAAEHGVYELWENSDITQAFASQNVVINNFDSTKYDAIWIVVEDQVSEGLGGRIFEFDRDILTEQYSGSRGITYCELEPTGGKVRGDIRTVAISLSGTTLTITFGDCTNYVLNSYGSAAVSTTQNLHLVPVRILGLAHNA